ncbi:hypothetical protein G3576_22855 [Roseomonas stagni]|uniref:Uncharacterized protein n=1 Tax=Falsiroseomonas algicola TaxID=2716930 RepID=A0A6M1LR23_9PROT|nr:hypothetical protein [Falsiroseomonas algicola]NGM22871.1 hypothetical protein [Falsiroseomonas algicola]
MQRNRRPFFVPALLGLLLNPAWLAIPFLQSLDPGDLDFILHTPFAVLLPLPALVLALPPLGWLLARRWPFGAAAAAALPFLPAWPFAVADALAGAGGALVTALLLAAPVWTLVVLRTAWRGG